MFAVLYVLLTRTRVGIIVRAATHRPVMVEALGHNLPVVFMSVFAAGAALAGLAGAVAGAFFPTGPNMAVDFGTLVFVVVVVGGLGSLEGALVASLMIGLFISFSVGLNWSLADLLRASSASAPGRARWAACLTLQLSTVAASMPFLLMLLVLLDPPGRALRRPPVTRSGQLGSAGLLAGLLLALPLVLTPNLVNAAIKMMIAALFALSFSLAMGQAGMLSFGHSAYYGLGAFATLHLMRAVEHSLVDLADAADAAGRRRRGLRLRPRLRLAGDAAHRRLLRHGDPGAGRAALHAGADLDLASSGANPASPRCG